MIEATLDTNTLASGAVATGGTIGALIDAWLVAGVFRVALSETILTELDRTLGKRSFTDRHWGANLVDYQTVIQDAATILSHWSFLTLLEEQGDARQ